jgi:hypothetical protein
MLAKADEEKGCVNLKRSSLMTVLLSLASQNKANMRLAHDIIWILSPLNPYIKAKPRMYAAAGDEVES